MIAGVELNCFRVQLACCIPIFAGKAFVSLAEGRCIRKEGKNGEKKRRNEGRKERRMNP
jgi:hypothetical protein